VGTRQRAQSLARLASGRATTSSISHTAGEQARDDALGGLASKRQRAVAAVGGQAGASSFFIYFCSFLDLPLRRAYCLLERRDYDLA
jgi:hypothetical protein